VHAPPIAAAQTESARLGSVAATLGEGSRTATTLTITRAGHVAYRRAVSAAGAPASVRVLHLDGGREPQVLLELTGRRGTVAEVFTYVAKKHAYTAGAHTFQDSPVRLRRLDRSGPTVFVTSDPAFAGRFADAADSGRPVKVFEVFGDMFGDVTGAYPKLIAADAARWLRAYQATAARGWQDSAGFAAAWAADENELGNMHSADAFLEGEAQAGHLNGARLSGKPFVLALDRYLYQVGYVPMCGGA
jgi:hypothetical protein